MRKDGRGRHARILSDYHLRLHIAAQERAAQMIALRKLGYSYHEIGKRFGITSSGVYSALRRQGLR